MTKPAAKTRTPKAVTSRIQTAAPSAGEFTFVDCEQPGMVLSARRDTAHGGIDLDDAKGAYVKVAPTVRSSERSGIDTKAIRERLLAAGALAVVVAPIVVPDSMSDLSSPSSEPPRVLSPEQHLREWFAAVKGASSEQVRAALEQALVSVSEAGL
jgi:hypothetical protein